MDINNYNEVLRLQDEQQQLSREIQELKLKQVYNCQSNRNAEKESRMYHNVQSELMITDNFLMDLKQNGKQHEKSLGKVFLFLCGPGTKSKITCYVKESIDGRKAFTDTLVAQYSNMVNNLKESLANNPGVRANKAMRQAIDNLKVGVESFGEKIHGEEMERARMKQVTQSLIQANELNMRDLNIRLTAVYEEVNEYEDAHQSPEQAKTKATPISQHSSTVQYGPEREPENAERMQVGIVEEEDFTFSPIKIDETLEFLSSQLSDSSIHESTAPPDEPMTSNAPPATANLNHTEVRQDDVRIDRRDSVEASASGSDTFVEPPAYIPKRNIASTMQFPPAKKPCYGEQFVSRESQNSQMSTQRPANKRDVRNDPKQNVAVNVLPSEPMPEMNVPRKVATQVSSHGNQSENTSHGRQSYGHDNRSGFESSVPSKEKPTATKPAMNLTQTIVPQPSVPPLNNEPKRNTSGVSVKPSVGTNDGSTKSKGRTGNDLSFGNRQSNINDNFEDNSFSGFSGFNTSPIAASTSTGKGSNKSENNKNADEHDDFDNLGFGFNADSEAGSGFQDDGFGIDFEAASEFEF